MSDRKSKLRALEARARELGLNEEQVEGIARAMFEPPTPQKTSFQKMGVQFGRYTLIERLGDGVLSKVYKGTAADGRTVVLKILRPDYMKEPYFARFIKACERMLTLFHPNWIISHELIQDPGLALVSEYLDGAPFSVNDEPVPIAAVAFIITEILNGLSYLHDQQLYHGNIRPTNAILCRDGSVKLLDWGMQKVLNPNTKVQSAQWYGNLSHMAPEAYHGEWSPAIDIYALGMMAWELLAGRSACPHQNPDSQRRWHSSMGPISIDLVRNDCPKWMVDAIKKMCTQSLEERPKNAQEALFLWQGELNPPVQETQRQPLELPVAEKNQIEPTRVEEPAKRIYKPRSSTSTEPYSPPSIEAQTKAVRRELHSKKKPLKRVGRVRTRVEREKARAKKANLHRDTAAKREVAANRRSAALERTPKEKRGTVTQKERIFQKLATRFTKRLASHELSQTEVSFLYADKLGLLDVLSVKGFSGSLISYSFQFAGLIQKGYLLIPYELLINLFNRSIDPKAEMQVGLRVKQLSRTDSNILQRFLSGFIDDLRNELPRQILASDPTLSMPETQGKMWTGLFRVGPSSPTYGMLAVSLPESLFQKETTNVLQETVLVEDELQEEILEIPVRVRVCLHSFRMSYHEIQKIQIGSFIPLPKEWNTRLRILVNDKDAFVGEYGDVEGCHAAMIHKICKNRGSF